MNIELQVIGAALRSIADEMGAVLVRSAFFANIKERRDCSTALFDTRGRMIAQAEHIPVHLAMPDAVAAVRAHLRPGEAKTNDPFAGGTHLPDTPCHAYARGLRGHARPPRRRGRHRARQSPAEPVSSRTRASSYRRRASTTPRSSVSQMRNPDEPRRFRAQLAAHALARGGSTSCASAVAGASGARRTAAPPPSGSRARSIVWPPEHSTPARRRRRVRTRVADIPATELTSPEPRRARRQPHCPLAVTRSACYFVVRCPPTRTCRPPAEPSSPSTSGARALAGQRASCGRGRGQRRETFEPDRERPPPSARRCPCRRRDRAR